LKPFPNLCNQISFFIPLFVAAFSFIVMAFAIQRYFARRTKVLICLSCFLLFVSLAVFFDPFFTLLELSTDVISEPPLTTFWTLGTVFPFAMNAVANAFMTWFIVLTFYQERKRPFFYVLVISSLAMACLIPVIGIASDSNPALADAYFGTLVTHLAISLAIYLQLAVKAFRTRARIRQSVDMVSHAGMLFIGLCSIFLVATFVSFTLQELPEIVPEFAAALVAIGFKHGGCSYFITIGWILSGTSGAMLYAGWIMPDWLRRLIEVTKTAKK
jgi:hypothetical protein